MSDEHIALSVDPHGIESTMSTATIFSGVKFTSGIRWTGYEPVTG